MVTDSYTLAYVEFGIFYFFIVYQWSINSDPTTMNIDAHQ